MSDNNELMVQQQQAMMLLSQLVEQQEELSSEMEYTYPSAYARVLHPSSRESSNHPPGTFEVRYSREEKEYTQVLAVYPIDVIGSVGEWAKTNPTPRNFQVPYTDEALIEKYGHSFCRSAGNFKPDPMYYNRTLNHPDARNREFVRASERFGSDKMINVPMTYTITEETDCRTCPFGKPLFSVKDADGKVDLLCQQACRPSPIGVFYVIGMVGTGALPQSKRGLVQVPMFKQAQRTMFGGRDKDFQKEVGIFAPMEDFIKAKPIEMLGMKIIPNAVIIPEMDNAQIIFPLLLGGILHEEKKGTSAIPFVYNPANTIRNYMRNSSESNVEVKLNNAINQAVDEFSARIKLFDVTHGKKQIYELLQQTVAHTMQPQSMAIIEEYTHARFVYNQVEDGVKAGYRRLTTPFQPVSSDITEGEEQEENTFQNQPTRPNATSIPTQEDWAKELQALQNANQMFMAEEESVEESVEESPTSFFTQGNNVWGD